MVKRTSTHFIARMIEGAKPSEMPGFIPPQLATLKLRAPAGDKWIHEIKFDGYRIQVHLYKGKVKIFTRNGHDWANRFHLLAESFDIPVERAIFDGAVVVIKDGRANFSELWLHSPAANRGAWCSSLRPSLP
jgi:bifunctional non-homologous end joining protein LigD